MDLNSQQGGTMAFGVRSFKCIKQSGQKFLGTALSRLFGLQVSEAGLEAHPEDMKVLLNLFFSTSLRSMLSFLGSLNY